MDGHSGEIYCPPLKTLQLFRNEGTVVTSGRPKRKILPRNNCGAQGREKGKNNIGT